jgi:hypothetical protein
MKKINVYKPTNDDWYPAYQVKGWSNLQLVCVSFIQTGPDPARGNGQWRVCVWGADDCGMERDYDDRSEAMTMFYRVISWEFVDLKLLREHGFVSA